MRSRALYLRIEFLGLRRVGMTPFREDQVLTQTLSPYACTKLAGEHLCSNYSYLYGIRCRSACAFLPSTDHVSARIWQFTNSPI